MKLRNRILTALLALVTLALLSLAFASATTRLARRRMHFLTARSG